MRWIQKKYPTQEKIVNKVCGGNSKIPASYFSLFFIALMSLPLVQMTSSYAAQMGDDRSVSFHGTLKRKPCHISSDRDINIHFGNVGINKVDGQRYAQDIPYTLQYDETDPSFILMMSIKGAPSGFENTALMTNAYGLGIRILQNGQLMKINEPVKINYGNPPKLQAVPVQRGGEITGAEFFCHCHVTG